jgi:hypothetical protein
MTKPVPINVLGGRFTAEYVPIPTMLGSIFLSVEGRSKPASARQLLTPNDVIQIVTQAEAQDTLSRFEGMKVSIVD